jgi:hypothetical protein
MSELKLITPRRNFLIRALGFTAAGATLPVGIIAAEDARSRIEHHQAELVRAWRDYYGSDAVRSYADVRPPEATYASFGRQWPFTSSFAIWGGSHPEWGLESHAWKMAQPFSGNGRGAA